MEQFGIFCKIKIKYLMFSILLKRIGLLLTLKLRYRIGKDMETFNQ